MKLLLCTIATTLLVGSLAAIDDPCNYNGYPPMAMADPDGDGPMDGWKFTWSDDTSNAMRTRACHSCESCTQDALAGIKYVENCAYPNGFRSARVSMDNEPPFCLTVSGAGNSMVQVLIETEEDDDHLCVESIGSKIALNEGLSMPAQCGEGQINACFPGENSGDMRLIVYCDTACPEADINFKYKVMHSNSRSNYDQEDGALANIDMWCMMQDGTQAVLWPSDMMQDEPNNFDIIGPKARNSASSTTSGMTVVFALLASVVALLR